MRVPSPQKLMTSNTPLKLTPYPWEQWSRLPKEERDAELKEAVKESASSDQDDAVGHHIVRPPFPFFDSVDDEAVDEPCYTDFIVQRGLQKQELSADASGFDWFQMHHDDGIMDGHLDVEPHAAPAGGDQGSHADPLIGGTSAVWAFRTGEGAPGSRFLIHFEPSTFIGGESPHRSGPGNAGCATVDEALFANADPVQHTNQDLLA